MIGNNLNPTLKNLKHCLRESYQDSENIIFFKKKLLDGQFKKNSEKKNEQAENSYILILFQDHLEVHEVNNK